VLNTKEGADNPRQEKKKQHPAHWPVLNKYKVVILDHPGQRQMIETLLTIFVIYPLGGLATLGVLTGALLITGRYIAKPYGLPRNDEKTYTLSLPYIRYVRVESTATGKTLKETLELSGSVRFHAGITASPQISSQLSPSSRAMAHDAGLNTSEVHNSDSEKED
jgi:hypothetical protein